jgi:hypothetical protein
MVDNFFGTKYKQITLIYNGSRFCDILALRSVTLDVIFITSGRKMAKVVQVLKVVRNNWKKSLFIFAATSYSVQYAVDKYK